MWLCDECANEHRLEQTSFACDPMDYCDRCDVCQTRVACRTVEGEFHMTELKEDGPNVCVFRLPISPGWMDVKNVPCFVLFTKPMTRVFIRYATPWGGRWKRLTDEEVVKVRSLVDGRPLDRPELWLDVG